MIIVSDDLSSDHPPSSTDPSPQRPRFGAGRSPQAGGYTVLADVYPKTGPLPNFQLRYDIHADGKATPQPLPPFKAVQTVDGYRVQTCKASPKLQVAVPKILKITVTAPNGKPAPFEVYYGALAHAIFFQKGTLAYFHTHVCGPNTPACTSIVGQPTIKAASTKPGVLHAGVLLPGVGDVGALPPVQVEREDRDRPLYVEGALRTYSRQVAAPATSETTTAARASAKGREVSGSARHTIGASAMPV